MGREYHEIKLILERRPADEIEIVSTAPDFARWELETRLGGARFINTYKDGADYWVPLERIVAVEIRPLGKINPDDQETETGRAPL